MMRTLRAALLLLLLAACDTPGGTSDLTGLPSLALTEELRYGHVDDPDSGFARIATLEVGSEGSLYVYDASAAEIRVFDTTGQLVRRFGRRGQGPGEFDGVTAITVLGDAIWTADGGNARLAKFTHAGEYVTSVPANPRRIGDSTLRISTRPARVLTDGRLIGVAATGGMRSEPGPHFTHVPRLGFDEHGEVVDTIGTSIVRIMRLRRVTASTNTVSLLYRQYPADPIELESSAMRVRIEQPPPESDSEAWLTISRLDDDDVAVWTRRYRYVPRRVDAGVREKTLTELSELFFGDRVSTADGARALGEVAEFPDYLPFAEDAMLGRDGTVWLSTGDPGTPGHWVVIAPTGEPVGTVTLPPFRGPRIMTFQRDRVWHAREDSLGVPYIGRYAVRP